MSIPLTMIVPNKDRFDPSSNGTKYFFESLYRQTSKNFRLMIIDGGSKNYSELQSYFSKVRLPHFILMQKLIQGKFHKTLLNNTAIRMANTPYIMTTDADIFFAPKFIETVTSLLSPDTFIESRTLYWKNKITDQIYSGKIDIFNNLDACKIGRIKKRTTPGGCQCGHRDIWEKVRGYDERYIGWGSEDVDLLARVYKAGIKVIWIGETREDIMVFHQPHNKINYNEDMRDQDRNLVYYRNIKNYTANPDGWGGKP